MNTHAITLVALTSLLLAQDWAGPRRASAQESLAAGDAIRFRCVAPGAPASILVEGLYAGLGHEALLLQSGPEAEAAPVPLLQVRNLQVRRERSRHREGALLGAVGGFVLGGLVAYVTADDDGLLPPMAVALGAGLFTGGIGVLVGAGVGSRMTHVTWEDVQGGWEPPVAGTSPSPASPCPETGTTAAR